MNPGILPNALCKSNLPPLFTITYSLCFSYFFIFLSNAFFNLYYTDLYNNLLILLSLYNWSNNALNSDSIAGLSFPHLKDPNNINIRFNWSLASNGIIKGCKAISL